MIQIRFVWPKPTQVLIYGELGEIFLRKVVPSSYSIEVLPIREGLPVTIRLSFFRQCLINYVRRKLSLRQAYFSALIDEFKPRAVITFVDNNAVLGAYAELHSNVLVISIQNAVRSEATFAKQVGRAPLYFSLGELTNNMIEETNVSYQRVEPVGSMLLGLYLAENAFGQEESDLVFVSSYRATWDAQNDDYHKALLDAHQAIFNHLLRFAKAHSKRIVVLAKGKVLNEGEHFAEEEEFYRKLANGADYTLVSSVKDTFTSYRTVLNANLVISIDSTLAYEMLSVGRKIIFGWVSNTCLKSHEDAVRYTQYLPESLILNNEKYDEFYQKVSTLINLPPEDYDVTIKQLKSKCVNQDINNPPHLVIEREIRRHIEQNH
jgi:surface carbohydrate biosynthesis protein